MKIVLSKSQWENIGIKANWMKKEAGIFDKIKNMFGLSWDDIKNITNKARQMVANYNKNLKEMDKIEALKKTFKDAGITKEDVQNAIKIEEGTYSPDVKSTNKTARIDARVWMAILVIIFAIITYLSVKNIFVDLQTTRAKQLESIEEMIGNK